MARDKLDTKITYLSLKSCSSSDEHIDQCGNNEVSTQTKPQAQRSNTTVHVCWHRSTSISMKDELLAVEDEIGKDFVFKLQYKNHIYFFRAESEYTYNRWIEVISSVTQCRTKRKQILINEKFDRNFAGKINGTLNFVLVEV
ncbi:hypothetical protein NQ317_002349 [Molorchus minor]|uniref:PH domain-containing protein n=1 Tax=Molorchus minor TaxID=1323400 RepID=A0ABQ9IYE8_9CUCU|nr:hypothetical protein NQ317_002349 [Molorchus minor]